MTGALRELARRYRAIDAIRGEMFARQLAVIDDTSQFRAGHPGRRSGKSETIPRDCAIEALTAGENEAVILGAETQKKAKALHWNSVMGLVVRHGLPLVPRVQESAFVTPWNSRIVFWGLDRDKDTELLRGFKMRAARFDEAQTYSPKIPHLVSSVLEPALGDTGGSCIFWGTPTVTRIGPWSDICTGVTPGWSVHHWTVLDNPKFPRDARSMLDQVLLRNKWTEDEPTFQREWMGRFVNDAGMMVYAYNATRNSALSLPCALDRGDATMGIDYGTTNDPTAWTVVWSQRGSRETYVLETVKRHGLLPDDAAAVTKSLLDRWQPTRIVGDGGGLGAPYVRAFNRRYSHLSNAYVQPADKLGMLGQITLTSNELAAGRIRLLPASADLASELSVLPWKDAKREAQHPDYPNDCADSFRYAFVAHHFRHDAPAEELDDRQRSLRDRQRKAAQSSRGTV